MVFDLDGEALVSHVKAGALGDGPALEDAVPAEAEVVVEARGGVLLNDEGLLAGGDVEFGFGAGFSGRLGGDGEVPHGAVAGELLVYKVGGKVGGRAWLDWLSARFATGCHEYCYADLRRFDALGGLTSAIPSSDGVD